MRRKASVGRWKGLDVEVIEKRRERFLFLSNRPLGLKERNTEENRRKRIDEEKKKIEKNVCLNKYKENGKDFQKEIKRNIK